MDGILKIKQFNLKSSSQTFQEKQRGTNIWEGNNILRFSSRAGGKLKIVTVYMINVEITFVKLISWA